MERYVVPATEVEAVQWTGDNFDELRAQGLDVQGPYGQDRLEVITDADGDASNYGRRKLMWCARGSWIVKLPDGTLRIVSEEAFEAVYRKVRPVELTEEGRLIAEPSATPSEGELEERDQAGELLKAVSDGPKKGRSKG